MAGEAPVVWEYSDNALQWNAFDETTSEVIEHAYNCKNATVEYSTVINGAPEFDSVHFFEYDGYKVNKFGFATPLRRVPSDSATPFSAVWEYWSRDDFDWKSFMTASSIEIERNWQDCQRAKIFNEPNQYAGFSLKEGNARYGILFATHGLKTSTSSHIVKGVRRRQGPKITRTVPAEKASKFHRKFKTMCASQGASALNNNAEASTRSIKPVFAGFNNSSNSQGTTNSRAVSWTSIPNFTRSCECNRYSDLIVGYNPDDLLPIANPEKDRHCSICADALCENSDDKGRKKRKVSSAAENHRPNGPKHGKIRFPNLFPKANSDDSTHAIDTTPTSEDTGSSGRQPSKDPKVVKLSKCGHCFHLDCIQKWFDRSPDCPECRMKYDVKMGLQPSSRAVMEVNYHPFSASHLKINAYPNTDIIEITYNFQGGIQGEDDPEPGERYIGTMKSAYLPKNTEGMEILRMLKVAWNRRLTFRVGRYDPTDTKYKIIPGRIPHKWDTKGGTDGYPDPTYFDRVRRVLNDLGVY